MKFYVIYSVDIPGGAWQGYLKMAESLRDVMNITEDADGEGGDDLEYGYLGEPWDSGRHRKWCGLLTREQFETFLRDVCIYPEETQTMGSISDMGWLPAISFNGDDSEVIQNAYVTPIPELRGREIADGDDRSWERVRDAVIRFYKDF